MLKIYGVPISVHTRKVIVAAIAKGLAHEVVPVVPVIPDNLPPDWRELSPTGLIPALKDGDFCVSDSSAICAYLERKHPTPPLYPQPAQDYAQALSLEHYAGTLFSNVVRPLFHEVFVHPKVLKISTDQSKIHAVLSKAMPEAFGYLDRVAGGEFLVGKAMSMADVAVASNLVTYQYIGFDLNRTRFPRLAALFDRVLAQPAMQEALEREQPVAEAMGLQRDFLAPALAVL
ncbi:MAG: glutathione S-transferase family protein [Burkholderiales bacterium]